MLLPEKIRRNVDCIQLPQTISNVKSCEQYDEALAAVHKGRQTCLIAKRGLVLPTQTHLLSWTKYVDKIYVNITYTTL
jgi:hypothetical protein